MSQRRACSVLGICRMMVRYTSVRPDDTVLRERMRAIAHERRRFGYRRIHVLLKREGTLVNHKKLFRLYREEKLSVRKRGGRKRAIGSRSPALVPLLPNMRWSLDFVSDQLTDGRRRSLGRGRAVESADRVGTCSASGADASTSNRGRLWHFRWRAESRRPRGGGRVRTGSMECRLLAKSRSRSESAPTLVAQFTGAQRRR